VTVALLVQLRARIGEIRRVGDVALTNAAPRILAKLTGDARTKRGNVPSYGKFGEVPITSKVEGRAIAVTAADWVMGVAEKKGQPEQWADILREEVHSALGDK
jgi:hypothetical protein